MINCKNRLVELCKEGLFLGGRALVPNSPDPLQIPQNYDQSHSVKCKTEPNSDLMFVLPLNCDASCEHDTVADGVLDSYVWKAAKNNSSIP